MKSSFAAVPTVTNPTVTNPTVTVPTITVQTVAVQLGDKTFYRVRIGPYDNMVNIEKTVISLKSHGFEKPVVVIK